MTRWVTAALAAVLTMIAAAPASAQELVVSSSPTGTDAAPLADATLSGDRYVRLDVGDAGSEVQFYIDGVHHQTERNAPYDFAGGDRTTADAWDTTTVADGQHSIEARWSGGSTTATFAVRNGAAPEPRLLVSTTADRAGAAPLGGSTIDGARYVFLDGVPDGAVVAFHLDDALVRTEAKAPYDLGATAADGTALPWDPTALAAGDHTVRADVAAGGSTASVTATFTFAPDTSPPPPPGTRTLAVDGDRFLLDGQPFDMWGVRTASATQDQAQTNHLIAQFDEYKAHGVNTVTVFYTGSRGGFYNPWSRDGASLDAGHQGRMEQIIKAADARGMVVVVGLFYQHAPFSFDGAGAVRRAVRTATAALRPYRNVVINIANEHTDGGWADSEDVYDMRSASAVLALMDEVESVDPARLVGGGGYHRASNRTIGRSSKSDVLLFDTGGGQRNQEKDYEHFRAHGVTKPIVNVEQFGGWTRQFARGIFPDSVKAEYRREVESAARIDGLYTFFHNNPWMQLEDMRYDLGGNGTSSSPGIRWYFEAVRAARGLGGA